MTSTPAIPVSSLPTYIRTPPPGYHLDEQWASLIVTARNALFQRQTYCHACGGWVDGEPKTFSVTYYADGITTTVYHIHCPACGDCLATVEIVVSAGAG